MVAGECNPGVFMKIALVGGGDHSEVVRKFLLTERYECDSFLTGREFLRAWRDQPFSLVVLDWDLRDMNGHDIVAWVRRYSDTGPPVLLLTERPQELGTVAGIEAGADDFMLKPVRPAELTARISVLLQRWSERQCDSENVLKVGNYTVDIGARSVSLSGVPVALTPRELNLALSLFRGLGRLTSRAFLEQAVWNRRVDASSRTLNTHLSRLRVKLALRPENGVRLTTVYGVGYRLETVGEVGHLKF